MCVPEKVLKRMGVESEDEWRSHKIKQVIYALNRIDDLRVGCAHLPNGSINAINEAESALLDLRKNLYMWPRHDNLETQQGSAD
jgi:hypothetical protein